MKQAKAASHIRELLMQKGFDIPSHTTTVRDQLWTVFERKGRQVGIDEVSGIWVRGSDSSEWRCLATDHTMSGALMAVDFLAAD